MTSYEKLLEEAFQNNLTVFENFDLSGTRFKGLYCNGSIALSNELQNEAEKSCILQEELGHHYTSSGNILDLHDIKCQKQERTARIWAYKNAVSIPGLLCAYKAGCKNKFEIAEYLNVTESFLSDAIAYYYSKYGLYTNIENYMIYFNPLAVLEVYK